MRLSLLAGTLALAAAGFSPALAQTTSTPQAAPGAPVRSRRANSPLWACAASSPRRACSSPSRRRSSRSAAGRPPGTAYVGALVDGVAPPGGTPPAPGPVVIQRPKLRRLAPFRGAQGGTRRTRLSSRKFSATGVGQEYYRHCLAMLVEAEAAQAVIDNVAAQPRGVIRVACVPGLLTYQMGGLIARFMTVYP